MPIPPVYRKRLLDPRGHATRALLPTVEVSASPVVQSQPAHGTIAPAFDDDRELYDALVLGTRDYCAKNGFTDVVIGLSGGIDSTIVACIAADALGAGHVHGVSMPSRYSSDHSKSDAELLATNLGIEYRTVPIEPAFQAYLDMLAPSFEGREPGLTYENIQSRCRGQTLMALSNEFGWMVLTTGNKSEMAVGYFTIYGDSVGGYGVIKDVLKTRVYDLCRYVNRTAGREIVPENVITKPPSAELRPDQRDDQSLPPYDVLDPILELYIEDDRTAGEIIELGHDEAIVRRITRLVDIAEYKRRQCPPGVSVSRKAFGKDRRLPDHQRLPRLTVKDPRPASRPPSPKPLDYSDTLRQSIVDHLARHERRAFPLEGHRHAAVAILLVDSEVGSDGDDAFKFTAEQMSIIPSDVTGLDGRMAGVAGGASFVLCRRSAGLNSHASQWALPGGRIDAGETAAEAALRETDEEVGVRLPPSAVLGELDDYQTRSGYIITPVVVWAGPTVELRPNPDEVLAVYRVGVHELLREDSPRFVTIPESDRPVVQVPLGGDLIHAPTGALLVQFRWVCLDGRVDERVADFEQPVFAWG